MGRAEPLGHPRKRRLGDALAELGRELGIAATTDRDALMALAPDAVVHTALTDDRVFESIEDLIWMLGKGVNVVSSGPVLLQWPQGILPDEILARIEEAGRTGNASLHVNGIDPGFANDVLPLVMTSLSQRIDKVLDGIEGLNFVRLGARDVVRHRIVQDIVEAYDRSAGDRSGGDTRRDP